MTKPPSSLCEFQRLHAVGVCVASARLISILEVLFRYGLRVVDVDKGQIISLIS